MVFIAVAVELALKVILAGLRAIQLAGGLKLRTNLCHVEKVMIIKTPLLLVTGDGKGSDKACGRFTSSNTARQVWCCNIPSSETDNTCYPCESMNFQTIQHLSLVALSLRPDPDTTAKDALSTLHGISQYPVDNAFLHAKCSRDKRDLFNGNRMSSPYS